MGEAQQDYTERAITTRRRVQTRDDFTGDAVIANWVVLDFSAAALPQPAGGCRRRIRAGNGAKSDSGEVMLYSIRVTTAANAGGERLDGVKPAFRTASQRCDSPT